MITGVGRLSIPARAPRILSGEVGDEFVVVDPESGHAHNLAGPSAAVWRATGSTADVDAEALATLIDLGLLDQPGISRRSMLKRTGVIAAGVGIATVALPMAEAAASGTAGAQAITLSPITGPRGRLVTVVGTGFFPSGSITSVTIGGITVTPSSTTIDGSGNFSFTFVVPPGVLNGVNTVSVTDNHNNTASKPFTVVGQANAATVTLTPASATKKTGPGASQSNTFSASGSGFASNSAVTVTTNNPNVTVTGSGTTNAAGVLPATTYTITTTQNGAMTVVLTFTDTFGNTATTNWDYTN